MDAAARHSGATCANASHGSRRRPCTARARPSGQLSRPWAMSCAVATSAAALSQHAQGRRMTFSIGVLIYTPRTHHMVCRRMPGALQERSAESHMPLWACRRTLNMHGDRACAHLVRAGLHSRGPQAHLLHLAPRPRRHTVEHRGQAPCPGLWSAGRSGVSAMHVLYMPGPMLCA